MGAYKALLIGNGKFDLDQHNLFDLQGPRNDLILLKEALVHPQVGLHEAADVVTLLDATSQEVRNAIVDFYQSARPEDQMLFYFSGHGRLDNYNRLYLCTRDTRVDRLLATAIPDTIVSEAIRDAYAKRFAIILDCCHSGQFKGGQLPVTLADGAGRFLLTSCQSAALSQDSPQPGGASAFTQLLVEALLCGQADENNDGFVELNEIYNYVLPRLQARTGQIPQRHLDKTVGDLRLGRLAPRAPGPAAIPAASVDRPILNLSTTQIEIKNVSPGENLPDEVIDVFNEGGGDLNWKAEADADWIQIEPGKGYIRVRLKPTGPGANRGNIYVRDLGRAGSRKVSVTVYVLEQVAAPALDVSPPQLDFGTLIVGASVTRSVRLLNRGAGKLRAKIRTFDDRLQARLAGDVVDITVKTEAPGRVQTEIEISSAGGSARVPILALIEPGPVLEVEPRQIHFGQIQAGDIRTAQITIRNIGSGKLEWSEHLTHAFFQVRREDDILYITLNQLAPGNYLGSIQIQSNGGSATVNLQALVQPKPAPPMIPAQPVGYPMAPPPIPIDLTGWWRGVTGSLFITGQGSSYQYIDYNLFGVEVGRGMMMLLGNTIRFEGMNALLMGVQGQLVVQGQQLSGTVWSAQGAVPVLFTR